jgi:CRISPR-associated endoribonuclease Cas6
LVSLEAIAGGPYAHEYHHHLQGLIYGFMRDTKYAYVHDKKGYKFFCMSNVFPAKDLVKGDERHLLISSPDAEFVTLLASKFRGLPRVRVGTMHFRVRSIQVLEHRLPDVGMKLITGTPVVVRIPQKRLAEYGIVPPKAYDYVYWRSAYSLTAFAKQVEENLVKKYHEFGGTPVAEAEVLPLLQQLRFRKQVSTRLHFDAGDQVVIGSAWEFGFSAVNEAQRRLLEFGFDAGFGEMNSKGFGFMNVLK